MRTKENKVLALLFALFYVCDRGEILIALTYLETRGESCGYVFISAISETPRSQIHTW